MKRAIHLLTAIGLVSCVSGAVQAQTITNGSFESTTNGTGQLGFNTDVTGWSIPPPNGSYSFVFASGTADTSGATSEYGNLKLWGPNDGSNNGLPASSPDGGNFIASDGPFQPGAISQTITGLTAGASYTIGFYFAAAQQYTFNGATSSGWDVSFGNSTQSTALLAIPDHGFSGWQHVNMTFIADGTSDKLSFSAVGLPGNGAPPFSLLDGVTLSTTPEGSSMGLLSMGLLSIGGVGAFVRRRNRGDKPTV